MILVHSILFYITMHPLHPVLLAFRVPTQTSWSGLLVILVPPLIQLPIWFLSSQPADKSEHLSQLIRGDPRHWSKESFHVSQSPRDPSITTEIPVIQDGYENMPDLSASDFFTDFPRPQFSTHFPLKTGFNLGFCGVQNTHIESSRISLHPHLTTPSWQTRWAVHHSLVLPHLWSESL